jgi:hypothetical protein
MPPLATRPRTTIAIAAVALVLAACGPTPSILPSAGPTGPAATSPSTAGTIGPSGTPADPAAVYGAVAVQVEAIRHLQPTADVAPVVIDQATLTANLSADFDASNPAAAVETSQRELIALGLLPPGTSLRQAVLALQSGQVAGYYSPEKNQLFVVSRAGGIGATQRVTYAHEFTHQLQDQHFDLGKLKLEEPDQGDRSLARLSLVEGDAVSVQQTWMLNLSQDELGQVLADSLDPAGLAALQAAPVILQETALFPYTTGLRFVQTLLATGGYDAVNAAFENPPASTEQVIHSEKYLAHEAPVAVTPADGLASHLGAGWSEAGRDTLGEEDLAVWLRVGGVASADASAAAAGWGGDRLVQLSGPNGATAVVLETAWDTAADATDFAAAAKTALTGLGLNGTVVHDAGTKVVSIAIGPTGTDVSPLAGALPG